MIHCGFFPCAFYDMVAPSNSYLTLVYSLVGCWISSLNLNYKLSESRRWIYNPTQLSAMFQSQQTLNIDRTEWAHWVGPICRKYGGHGIP